MQIFLLIVIFILIVINLKQADELRDLERKTLMIRCAALPVAEKASLTNRKKHRAVRAASDLAGHVAPEVNCNFCLYAAQKKLI